MIYVQIMFRIMVIYCLFKSFFYLYVGGSWYFIINFMLKLIYYSEREIIKLCLEKIVDRI